MLHHKTGAGSDYLGWIDYLSNYDKEEFERIKKVSNKIRNNCAKCRKSKRRY